MRERFRKVFELTEMFGRVGKYKRRWKVSWLLSELEAGWNEVKPLVDSNAWDGSAKRDGYAEGSRAVNDNNADFNMDDDDGNDDESLPGINAPKVATVLATLLAKLVARSEKLSDDEPKLSFSPSAGTSGREVSRCRR